MTINLIYTHSVWNLGNLYIAEILGGKSLDNAMSSIFLDQLSEKGYFLYSTWHYLMVTSVPGDSGWKILL